MRKVLIVVLIFISSCKTDDANVLTSKDFLVSKVYDYQDRLLANYVYNDSGQLIKREFNDPETGNPSDLVLTYKNNLLEKIAYIDYIYPQFNNEKYFFYDDSNKMIREETHQNNTITNHINLKYNDNGTLKYLYTDDGTQLNLYEYDQNLNIISTTSYLRDHITGETYEEKKSFSYDVNAKPYFGISYNLPLELLPKMGSIANWEKGFSKNNMIESNESGTTWNYKYNELGLPISINTKWEGITTEEPMVIKIEYIQK